MSRPLPILFIHGFNGDPGDWTDGGFRQYLVRQGGLDPDLVRIFRYGVAEDGMYNNRGDLRQIEQTVSFGDMVVPAASAREIPGVQATPHPYVTEKVLEVALRRAPDETATRSLYAFLPDTSHGRLLSNPAVHKGVLALLND